MEEIDIIELLKRVKEGKAPKKIEINGNIYNYEEWNTSNIQFMYENNNYNMFIENIGFDTKIKILDKPFIEELHKQYNVSKANDLKECVQDLGNKLNEIIRYLRSKE